MTLKADILYKSNWQQGALKSKLPLTLRTSEVSSITLAKRRNKWICALKTSMAELKIYGSKGDPSAKPGPTKYTQVPWEEFKASERTEMPMPEASISEPRIPRGEWSFTDQDAVVLDRGQDVFDEADELDMSQPQSRSRTDLRQRRMTRGPGIGREEIEMSRSGTSTPRGGRI